MVINRQRRLRVAIGPLEVFLCRVQRALRLADHELTVCLVSDAAIARLNRAFRGKRGPTDVLSFPANEMPPRARAKDSRRAARFFFASSGFSPAYLGDIAISAETARRNAQRFGRTLPDELRMLILHGALHLAGYDHETDNGAMNRLERRLRRRLRLT